MAEKILVVDDDVDSLKLIGLMLQRNGYQVLAANSGGQALTRAANDKPDLIILDVMMPDMNGYEVCRRLRANADTQPIPIIMFTAKTLIDDKVAGFEAGADDYLTKPTHPAELASRVKAILARSVPVPKPPAPGQAKSSAPRGTTIGVLGAKGGVGTTTIALNIATARLMASENPVVADFRLGSGSMGLSIGLARSHGMANVLARPVDEIRPKLIESELATHPSGLRALLSSARPVETTVEFEPDAAVALIRALRAISRPAVFDLGSGLDPITMQLQAEMDQLVVVIDPVSVTLAMAREILHEISAQRTSARQHVHVVVVNRAASSTPPSWSEIEQYLGFEIRATISLASELVTQALQANVPVVMFQPTAIASSQMLKLAEELYTRARMFATGESN